MVAAGVQPVEWRLNTGQTVEGAYATVEATHTSSAGHVKKLLLILLKQGDAWYIGQTPLDPRYGIAEKFVGGHYFGRAPVPGNSAPYDAFCGRVKSIVRFLYQYQDALKNLSRKAHSGELSEQMLASLFQRGQERFLHEMRDLYTPFPANANTQQKSA